MQVTSGSRLGRSARGALRLIASAPVALALTGLIALSACTAPKAGEATVAAAPAPAPSSYAVNAATMTETRTASLEASRDVSSAASVVRVDPLDAGDFKLFGTAGGDPAINGLYTYLAAYVSPADGWNVFQIGDFNDYKIISQSDSQVILEVSHSIVVQETGEVVTASQQIAVPLPAPEAASITVTPLK